MLFKRKNLYILSLLLSILALSSADFEDIIVVINSVSTVTDSTSNTYKSVSLEGGAYLYIKGSGFSTRSASSNVVTVGDVDCPVVEFLTTSTQVVCVVPPSDTEKSVAVKVIVDENRIGACSTCWIYYSYWYTPLLAYMLPNAGNQGQEVYYYGRQRVASSLDVDYVKIGDLRCDPSNQNEFDSVTFDGSYMPAPCNVPENEAGYYNVTQRNLENTGYARKLDTLPVYRPGQTTYDFAVVPAISSISSNIGSPQGQIITITGTGFSSTDDNQVYLADTECTILSQSTTEIQCEVQPRTTPITDQGYHAGLKFAFYNNTDISSVKAGTAGTPTYTDIRLTSEIGLNLEDGYSSKLSGYFKAPVTGNYKFVVSADDKAQLAISTTPLVKTGLQTIINIESYTGYRFFYKSSSTTQFSNDVSLTAGNFYYLELYHQEGSGSDYATLGVIIPDNENTINAVPEGRSIKINCPTIYEVLDFKVTATGGNWRIRLDYLSSDGKKIDSTATTSNIAYNAAASTVSSRISSYLGLANTVTRTLYDSTGAVTTVEASAVSYKYTVTVQNYRTNGKLPVIETTDLTGTSVNGQVTQTTAPSDPVRGTFTINANGKTSQLAYSASTWTVEEGLRTLGYTNPIRVVQSGDVNLGAEWRIQFTGDRYPVTDFFVTHALTGCSNPSGINVAVDTIQTATDDLFYEVIPVDYLFTAEDNPQITVKSNGVAGNCPSSNCNYVIQSTGIPEVSTASYSAPTLTLSVSGVTTSQYNSNQIRVFFGNTECTGITYVDASIPASLTATCPTPEAGDFTPRVHFTGLGYASIASGVSPITIAAVISSVTPTQVNPNGGSILTITGTGFPASLDTATTRGIQVKVGSSACTLSSVAPTQIVCVSTPVASDSALTVSLNSKTATSSVLTLLTTYPTITSVSPNSVNPVLQTDITITGNNFDNNDITNTKIYLSNSTNSQVTECLPVTSTTTQITCKLLGAPTGSYSLYVQTSLGYSDTQPFVVKTVISSISPSSGSTAGGTILTIQGGSFSNIVDQTLVFIGGSNIACDVISSTSTQVKCKTQAKHSTYGENPQEVVLTTRIVEETICDTGATCTFTYLTSLTPTVTALSATSVSAGNNLVITGTGFTSAPSGTSPTVTIDDTICTIVTSTDTSITITVPTNIVPDKTATLSVNIAGKGDALFSVNKTIQVAPRLSSISPTSASTGGALITITGAGFQTGASVKVGSTACNIRSLTSTTITCRASSTGEVSLTYGDFTSVKCSTACTLGSSSSNTPTITSVSPLSPTSASAFTLTIVGTKFVDLGTAAVNLVSQTDKTVIFAGSVTSPTNTQITAAFTNVAAGSYSVEVLVGANVASSTSTNTVNVPLSATASPTTVSSIAGGATLTITGSGFFANSQKSSNKVSVCGFDCTVTQSAADSIQCQVPLFTSVPVKAAYPDLVSSSLLSATTAWSDSKKEANVVDLAFTTVYSSSNADCQIGFDIGSGLLADISEIKYFPDPSTTASKLKGTVIEGSSDNSTYTNIATIDANAHDGWNTITLDTTVTYRYYRLRGDTSTAKCALAELQFYGVVLSDSTVTDLNALTCSAQVTVNDKTQSISSAVTYKQSQTPTLTSISPKMGTTAGGTTITLTGTGFTSTVADITVLIDDIACTVATASSTQITCVTGAAPTIANRKSSLDSKLTIRFAGQGDVVVDGITYFYVDKWSDVNTWGGITPPRAGESVSIPTGQTILLDTSTPKLKAIIIEGALIFNDQDLTLDAEYILIRNGRLQIGTRANPIQSNIVVTIHGNKESADLPTYGNKVIAMMEGVLDIHGKERSHTWTVLDSTAAIGATSITVQGQVDWVAGEQIVIASTDHDHYMSETRKILTATVNSQTTTLTFAEPLVNRHYAGIQTFGGVEFEMRAEVGLLTRNVVIQGDETSEKNKYGVHIMAHSSTGDDSSIARISYTEVRQAGQAFNLGRYAIHFHLIGNVRESYVIGNAIHHTYNRAVTIHGVHFLKVQKNVAYWVMGHTIFIEDGIETHNVIEDNLVINTIASNSLLNTDQTPASFWITNPNNIWRRNHAAGSDRYGFWFDLREHPEGPSATTSICPIGEKLGEFIDNVAHSSGRYGLRIFHEHTPRTYPCLDYSDPVANPPIQSEFTNFFGWKNTRDAIIGEKLGAVKFKNVKAADNKRAGIEISDGNRSPADTLLIEDAWIVGKTPDNAGDDSIYIEGNSRGIITPKVDFFLAKNVHFYNFGANMTAIETCSHCEHPAATDAGARTSFFQGLTFSNVAQRVRFNIPYKEILVDRDGSLVGTPGTPGVVTHYYEHLDVPGCTRDETVYNGLVCGQTVTIRRVEFSSLTPFNSFELQDLEIYRNEQNSQGLYGAIPYRQKTRKSWAVPFVTGYSYGLSWASRADFTQTVITPSDVIVANDKPITLVFNHSEYRELFDVFPSSGTIKDNITNVTTLWDPSTVNALSTGSWYHDVTPQNLYFLVNGVNKKEITVQSVKCRIGCPLPASFTEKDGIIRLWSNATQWPNQVVPQDGDDVEIPGQWTIKLDVNSAKLKTLHVIGDLHFDSTVDDLVLTAERIWVEGQMFIGSEDSRYTKNAKVVLTGLRNSPSLILGEVQDVSNKVLAVTGNVTMYGALVNSVWARLQAPVQAGATTITVPSDVGWSVGDEIVISPTQRAYNEYEVRKIAAISGGVITLNGSLSHYHFGGSDVTKSTPFGDIDMRAEVGLLTRNIVVEGFDDDEWGGRIYVGEIYDSASDYYLRGRVDLDGVEMNNFGQKDTVLAGLTFERLVTSNNADSSVRRCVVRNSLGYEMKVVGSTGVTVENNLFFRSYKIQVLFEGQNTDIQFNNNLLIATEDRGLTSDAGDNAFDFSAAFYADGKFVNSQISGNIISGCYQQCWYTLGGDCSTQPEGPYTINNNVAHSGQVGWLVKDPNAVCNGVSHFTGYKLEQGVASMFKSAAIQGSNLIITDTEKGISLNLGGITDPTTITLKNSYVAGITPTGDANGYTGNNAEECSSRTGVMLPTSVESPKPIPPMPSSLPWYKVKSNHIWQSYFTMTNVTFENFKDDIVNGCTDNFAIISNHYASDNSASTKVSGLTLINVADDRKIYFELPDNGWIGVDDCGGYFCTGINNILVRDLDGSLAGAPASVFPATVKTIIDTNNGCAYNDAENAIICTDKGWGLLTFQSLDVDVLTRIISPIYVTSTNYTNKLNSYMDHVWDGFYTGLKRYSRFHSVIEDGTQYDVAFTGTLPNALQWGLQGALSTETTSVTYRYTEPKSLKVTNKTGGVVSPLVVKLAADKVIKTTDACGTNLYDLETRSITVQLTGQSDCLLSIQITNAVQASIRYSISIDEFFNQNGAASFVDKVAAILGINPASVRVVDIKSGSTIINFFIDSTHQDDTTESDAAALVELENYITVLQNAVDNGDLRVLNSDILNSSFSVNMIRPQDSTETVTSGNDVVIIVIAAVVGVLALTIGTYFAYRRYYRRRIVPDVDFAKSERQKFQMGHSVSPFIHTDNPLVVDISHSPSAFKDPSPLRSPVRSTGALESPERS